MSDTLGSYIDKGSAIINDFHKSVEAASKTFADNFGPLAVEALNGLTAIEQKMFAGSLVAKLEALGNILEANMEQAFNPFEDQLK